MHVSKSSHRFQAARWIDYLHHSSKSTTNLNMRSQTRWILLKLQITSMARMTFFPTLLPPTGPLFGPLEAAAVLPAANGLLSLEIACFVATTSARSVFFFRPEETALSFATAELMFMWKFCVKDPGCQVEMNSCVPMLIWKWQELYTRLFKVCAFGHYSTQDKHAEKINRVWR